MIKGLAVPIADRIIDGKGDITVQETDVLYADADLEELCLSADRIRRNFCSDKFDTCSIVNARSGRCSEDCKWCAQSAFHHTGIEEYAEKRSDEMVAMAEENDSHGVKRFSLVTSGRKVSPDELRSFCKTYERISRDTGLKTCASMGLLNRRELQMLKEAGVTLYECNLETAPSFFPSLCTTHTIEEKIHTLQLAKELGFELCSGGIIGMGETFGQRMELAFELRKIGVKSVPVNILTPVPGTRLENMPPLSDEEILRSVALFRFVLPDAFIRFAGGRRRMSRNLQLRLLRSGVNASLVGGLLTTAGTDVAQDYELFKQAGYVVG